ncbi:hypothetical protein GI374_11775 [Paracoccus sp. S-4012]|uniref:hypothetical protein n=1 Tax=Paracoccus sp. S-4012 TaxID=2665648 RepID=UPI0012B06AE0|nr:hypothetical protein [Paracoccus sp. S-4012]MRX51112.1 hypothetical protein [Paracoccus sp. S-4012]
MSESSRSKLPEESLRAMHTRFDRLEHMVRHQGAAAAEDRAHLRALMQTTGRHDDGFAYLYARLARIQRRLDLLEE